MAIDAKMLKLWAEALKVARAEAARETEEAMKAALEVFSIYFKELNDHGN